MWLRSGSIWTISLVERGIIFPEYRRTEDRRPSTAYDAKGLIKAAIRDPDPVLYFEHKKLYRLPRLREELPSDDYIVEIGKARVARAGRDLTIITFGAMVLTALDAAEELEKEGLDVEVIDLRTLAPLDKPAILRV